MTTHNEEKKSLNFIEEIIEKDLENGKNNQQVYTRFPPEPNGYLHIGHAKSICLNFGLGQKYKGKTNLRFDDTNPSKEETEYVESIKKDVEWLGFKWEGEARYASDYFDQLYEWAVLLIKKGLAYVDDSSFEDIQKLRGNTYVEGTPSPYRNRSIDENLELFEQMRNGDFDEGAKVLRAKIDMASPNMHMRDPILYRIQKISHHRTGDKWCIYPMYDFAHGQSDAIEGVTHSLCTLEFENHRPLYEWFLQALELPHQPQQIEFARFNLNYTIMSKRKLLKLVQENYVSGWDDPRMPTISGMRRRGYTPTAIRTLMEKVGISKRENIIEVGLLESCVRDDLNKTSNRMMAVLNPLKVTITNYPDDKSEMLEAVNNPEMPDAGNREIPFGKELYIERDDFMENPPKKYFRLKPDGMVRLKNAYIIKCEEVIKNNDGEVTELKCTYIPESKSGNDTSGIKVKGVIHWVSIHHAVAVEVHQYDRLFNDPDPSGHADKDFTEFINPDSLKILNPVYVEPALAKAKIGERFQFMRKGYYCVDTDSTPEKIIFNQTVGLRDSWAKLQKK